MTETMLTPRQVAERFNVSLSAVYMWGRQKKLPSIKVGQCVRFYERDVAAFIKPQGDKPEVAP